MARFYRRELDVEADRSTDAEVGSFATVEALRTEWPTMLRIIGVILMANVGFYMMFVYITTYLSEQVGVSTSRALEIDTIAMATLLLFVPVAGWMSDRIGRKPILLTASIGVLIFSVPLLAYHPPRRHVADSRWADWVRALDRSLVRRQRRRNRRDDPLAPSL